MNTSSRILGRIISATLAALLCIAPATRAATERGGSSGGGRSTPTDPSKPLFDPRNGTDKPRELSTREKLERELDQVREQAASERAAHDAMCREHAVEFHCPVDVGPAVREAHVSVERHLERPAAVPSSRQGVELAPKERALDRADRHARAGEGHEMPDRPDRGTARAAAPISGASVGVPPADAGSEPGFGSAAWFDWAEARYGYDPNLPESYGCLSRSVPEDVTADLAKDWMRARVEDGAKAWVGRGRFGAKRAQGLKYALKAADALSDPAAAAKEYAEEWAFQRALRFLVRIAPKTARFLTQAAPILDVVTGLLDPQETSPTAHIPMGPRMQTLEHRHFQLMRRYLEARMREYPGSTLPDIWVNPDQPRLEAPNGFP